MFNQKKSSAPENKDQEEIEIDFRFKCSRPSSKTIIILLIILMFLLIIATLICHLYSQRALLAAGLMHGFFFFQLKNSTERKNRLSSGGIKVL